MKKPPGKFAPEKQRLDLLVLFCPLLLTTEPHLAAPHLASYLKANNYHVEAVDFNLDFFRMFRNKTFIDFVREILEDKLYRLKRAGISNNAYYDYLKTNLALAALNSFLPDLDSPLDLSRWQAFAFRVFAVQAAFGFDIMIHNDVTEFLDDYFRFQGLKEFPRDLRLGVERRSTIEETVSRERLADRQENLFLRVFEFCLLKMLQDRRPKILGLSIATNEQIIQALSMARLAKEKLPEVHVTAGGSYVSYLDDDDLAAIMELGVLDSLVRYEGEPALPALIDCVSKGGSLEEVPNLIYLDKKNNLIKNPIGNPPALESTPIPDFDNVASLLDDNQAFNIYATRGCYWKKCAYCSYTTPSKGRPAFSLKPALQLVEEMGFLKKKYKVSSFNLISESIPPSYAEQVSKKIIEAHLKVEMSIWARPEKGFDQDLCNLMHKAGFRFVTLGVESLNDRVLNLMQKGVSAAESREVMANMARAGILLQINIMAGLPYDTYEDALQGYRMLMQDLREISIYRLVVGPFAVLRGSQIHRKPAAFSLEIRPRKATAFQPKGIFVPFDYQGDASFEEVIRILQLYHQPAPDSLPPSLPAYARLAQTTAWRPVDYKLNETGTARTPGYLFINYSRGETEWVEPIMGTVLINNKQYLDINLLILNCAHYCTVNEIYQSLSRLFRKEILISAHF